MVITPPLNNSVALYLNIVIYKKKVSGG